MSPIEFFVLFTVFLIQVLTTRSLNKGKLESRLWRRIWAVEVLFLGLILTGLAMGYIDFARWAMTAGVVVFLLRAGVRCFDYGIVKFAKKVLPGLRAGAAELVSGFWEIITVLVSLFAAVAVECIKALPEAMADAVITSDSESMENSDGPASLTNFKYTTGFGSHAFSLRDEGWDD